MSKRAIIFPGQGSQYPKMGLSLYQNFPEAKEIIDKVSLVSGIDLAKVIFQGQGQELKKTSIQQVAILAVSLAAYSVIKQITGDVDFLAGLSLGEYSCLYAAGVLSLQDTVMLVKTRAEAMQRAAENNPSSMLAVIGASHQALKPKEKELGFYLANINAPSQVVISVADSEKGKISKNLEEQGLRVVELEVSGGFHSPFMEPAVADLKNIADKINFSQAKIPIVSNTTAKSSIQAWEIKENLLKQLVSPVLWVNSIEYMRKEGVSCFFEVGPSRVLRGLMRKIDKNLKVVNIENKDDADALRVLGKSGN